MAEAIVYCDRCSKMIPAADIKSGEGLTTPGGAICAACLAGLDPERRAALRKLGGQAPTGRKPSSIQPAPKRPPTRKAALPPAARRRSGHTAQHRPVGRTQETKSKSGAVVLAGVGLGLVAGVCALLLLSSGSTRKRRGRRRRSPPPTVPTAPGPRAVPGGEEDSGPSIPQRGGLARLAGPPPPGVDLTRRSSRPVVEPAPAAPDVTRGLVAHWTFDEEGGDAVRDASGNGPQGSLENVDPADARVPGKVGGALRLDGVDDHVRFPSDRVLSEFADFTLAAWVRPDDTSTNSLGDPIISKESGGRGYQLTWHKDGRFGFMLADVHMTWSLPGKANGRWHHVAAVFAQGTSRLYVNGVEEAKAFPRYRPSTIEKLYVGAFVGRERFLKATIDDVRVYGRGLMPEEIAELYRAPEAEPPSSAEATEGLAVASGPNAGEAGAEGGAEPGDLARGLLGHWALDEEGGTRASDSSGNAADGELHGSPEWRPEGGRLGGALAFAARGAADDYVEIPHSAELDRVQEGDYTLAAWVKPESVPSGGGEDNAAYYAVVVKAGRHLGLQYRMDSRFGLSHWLSGDEQVRVLSKGNFPPRNYHHVAGVVSRAAGTATLYVDGRAVGSVGFDPGAAAWSFGRTPWRIGVARPGAETWRWGMHGEIDDVRIYGRALSASEIEMLYGMPGARGRAQGVTPPPAAPPGLEWITIFNGRDMSGWQEVGVGSVRIEDGVLIAEDNADLFYDAGWTEFALSFELKAEGKGETAAGLGLAHAPRGRPNFRVQAKFHRDGDLHVSDRNGRLWQSGAHWFPPGAWLQVKLVVKRGSLDVYRGEALVRTVSLAGVPVKSGGVYLYAPGGGVVRLRNVRVAVHSHERAAASPERPPAPAGPVDLSRGLVAHWLLDGLKDAAVPDASGNGHDARAVGGVSATAGRVGGALSFNGTGAYVEVSSGLDALHLADLTIAFWLKPVSLKEGQVLVAKRHDGKLAPYWTALRDGVFRFSWSYDTEPRWIWLDSTPGAVAAGEWTHVAVTRDCAAGDVLLYVNGERNAQILGHRPGARIGGTKPSQRGMKVTLGSRFIQDLNAYGRWFKGELDDVRVYSRPLSAAEIASIHAGAHSEVASFDPTGGGEGRPDPGDPSLAGYWKFDETRGATAADSSRQSNGGAIRGNVTFVADGRRKGAFHFDGEGDLVEVPASPSLDLPADLTLAMWLRRSPSPPGEFKVIGRPSQFTLSANNEGGVRFGYSYAAGDSFANWFQGGVVTGRWVHLAVVRDATAKELRLFVNGSLEETCRVRGPAGRSTSGLVMGDGFPGDVDDVCVYGRALGAAEIQALCGEDVVRKSHGLLGRYYDNASLTGEPVLTRVDGEIDFDWGRGSPDPAVPKDGFSVRWTGWVVPAHSKKYTFSLRHNDGARLWIDGDPVIDRWKDGKIRSKGSKTLQAGQRHSVKLEYYERIFSAVVQLRWKSRSQPEEIVPRSCLFPEAGK